MSLTPTIEAAPVVDFAAVDVTFANVATRFAIVGRAVNGQMSGGEKDPDSGRPARGSSP